MKRSSTFRITSPKKSSSISHDAFITTIRRRTRSITTRILSATPLPPDTSGALPPPLRSAGQTITCTFITRVTGDIRTTATITTVTIIGIRVFRSTTAGMCITATGHRATITAMATTGVRATVVVRVRQPGVSATNIIRPAAVTTIAPRLDRVAGPGLMVRTGPGHKLARATAFVRERAALHERVSAATQTVPADPARVLAADPKSASATALTPTGFVPGATVTPVVAATRAEITPQLTAPAGSN